MSPTGKLGCLFSSDSDVPAQVRGEWRGGNHPALVVDETISVSKQRVFWAMGDDKWVYDFAEGSKDMRDLLGGKGANVAEMTRVLGTERVPAGFTIPPRGCGA